MMVKRRVARSNWPFSADWAAGGDENLYYSMDAAAAQIWTEIIESQPRLELPDAPPDRVTRLEGGGFGHSSPASNSLTTCTSSPMERATRSRNFVEVTYHSDPPRRARLPG
jgi:hypothetical protein